MFFLVWKDLTKRFYNLEVQGRLFRNKYCPKKKHLNVGRPKYGRRYSTIGGHVER
jgi:hypothetical protein